MAAMQAHHKIADFRIQKNLTLQALAERVGTTKSQIDKLEKGERRLTVEWLQRIADALNMPVSSFFSAAPDGGGIPSAVNTLNDTALAAYKAPLQREASARPTPHPSATDAALAAPLPV